ncbi:Ku protein [Mycolicibacterium phlei]|uniref:non-homologous end joining protein Ku n=1 Tax=Mycolicibacterium phlei TaxID=1771 RepID=UPI00025AE55D|nr:Ku protein [Mycolicibacterium phlei]EID10193.1 hypothetical protein MPHLEI_22394 [Mycolicibacterium phlei RIVM601174]MBF4194642.1 hypothetical protein [Mycolicibacterium phlei]
MRAIWTGSISFGLVNVPVKLYGATEEHDIKAHQVHKGDGGRIRMLRVCEDCGEQVDWGDIAKRFEHEEHSVVLTDEDLDQISEAKNKTIDVLEFVPADDIDPMMWDKPYYLKPDKGKGAAKAYTLLTKVLATTDRVAIATFVMRSKTRLAALRIVGKEAVLVLHTLRWPDEIRVPDPVEEVEVQDKEVDLASQLIEAMSNEYNPDRYRDTYQEELRELIIAKAEEGQGDSDFAEELAQAEAEVDELIRQLEASMARKAAAKK